MLPMMEGWVNTFFGFFVSMAYQPSWVAEAIFEKEQNPFLGWG